MDDESKINTHNGSDVVIPLSNEEIEKRVNAAREGILFYMGEMRKLFSPHIRLTFIARNPSDLENEFPSYITDDADTESLIEAIKRVSGKLYPIHGVKGGRA